MKSKQYLFNVIMQICYLDQGIPQICYLDQGIPQICYLDQGIPLICYLDQGIPLIFKKKVGHAKPACKTKPYFTFTLTFSFLKTKLGENAIRRAIWSAVEYPARHKTICY